MNDSLSVKLESDPRLGLLRHSRGSAIIKDSLNGFKYIYLKGRIANC